MIRKRKLLVQVASASKIFKLALRTCTCTKQKGYSMLELLMATAVGGIVIAGSYTSYGVIGRQQQRVSAFAEVQSAGMPTVRLVGRDIRMAGRVAMDTDMDPVYGIIATPITTTDSGNACCDSITVVYDQDSTVNPKRCQILYSIIPRTNPTRNALYMTVTTLFSDVGDACTGDGLSSLVTDYVEDFQVVGSDNDSGGNPRLMDLSLVLKSQSQLASERTYTPPAQVAGNYNYTFTDNYYRDAFTMTINIRNLR
jgi:prepilin-type N-terminal cleavage/methylation domain-containing protein